jgi:hypothetical protein
MLKVAAGSAWVSHANVSGDYITINGGQTLKGKGKVVPVLN